MTLTSDTFLGDGNRCHKTDGDGEYYSLNGGLGSWVKTGLERESQCVTRRADLRQAWYITYLYKL